MCGCGAAERRTVTLGSPTPRYTYEVCPFEQAKQDHTSLGRWARWEDDHKTMIFENGQSCWNGPRRSMKVTVECAATTSLGSVDEPSTCAYTAVLKTPAACDVSLADGVTAHDEL